MMQFLRKKHMRDDRLLQIMLLLSLLRGSPDLIFDADSPIRNLHERDLTLGSSLGHAQISSSLLSQELHPKSLDRALANYQRSLLHDLNSLGDCSVFDSFFLGGAGIGRDHGIQTFLFNAETSLGAGPQPPVEGGYVTGAPLAEPIEDDPVLGSVTSHTYADMSRDIAGDLYEDLEFLEAIWKQDVDLGVPQDLFDGDQEEVTDLEVASKLDMALLSPFTKEKDHGEEPMGESDIGEIPDDKTWATMMNFTIDSETGELLATNTSAPAVEESPTFTAEEFLSPSTDQPGEANGATAPPVVGEVVTSPLLEFNLDEALKLVGLNATSTPIPEGKDVCALKDLECDSGCGDSGCGDSAASSDFGGDPAYPSEEAIDALNDSLDEMIQTSQLHYHHSRNFQGRLGGLVRSGSMEQRWQDLASLLSLPSPDPSHHAQSPPTPTMASHPHSASPVHVHSHPSLPPPIHHPHALYPSHEAPAPPPPPPPVTTPTVPRGVLLHNASLPPPMLDAHNITYTNSMGASSHLVSSSMNLTNNTEMPGSDHHHYKMETSSSLPPDMMYYQNSGPEMHQTTDGFLSSILNDEDLQLMDIPMTDYSGRGITEYGGAPYRYGAPEDPHRLPPVAQKKHQMFGKRFFQESPHAAGPSNNLAANCNNVAPGVPLVSSYPPHYVSAQGNTSMEGATAMDPAEMKYSCTMDFRPEVSGTVSVDNVHHNHTYHMSPEGPSGLNRQIPRDKKGKKSENDKNLSRDEKRARGMNLPITCDDIINLPMDEFNERISKYDLTEAQLSLIRDIRRRGKNKVAAQNCRKRKLDQIVHLAEEVKVIQYRKNELHNQLDHLSSERARIKHKFSLLYRHIFQSLRDPDGNPYSPHEYSLQQSADGSILLVPRSSPPHSMDQVSHHKSRPSKEDSGH